MALRDESIDRIRSAILGLVGKSFYTATGAPFTLEAAPGGVRIIPRISVGTQPRPVSFERLDVWIERWFLRGDRDVGGYVSNGRKKTPSASFRTYMLRVFQHLSLIHI